MLNKNDILHTYFDDYLILEKIGEGGNGTVYKVQSEDGKIYAAKVICKNDVSKEKIKRFKNEIGFCQKYDNDYISKVIDYGYLQAGGKEYLFYIMLYFECNLRKMMSNGLKIETAIKLFLSLCEGLRFAHVHRCIHRDIKPENVLIKKADDNCCVIADFGIAHFIDSDKKTTVETKETSRLANFSYHAPEQASAGYKPEPTTDIFALGLILNEMITGFVPAGDNYKKIADVNENFKFLDNIVSKMICQKPSDRYQSIDELLVDYEARTKRASNELKISSLQAPLLLGDIHDELTDNPISIKDIKTENYQLKITLTNTPNEIWKMIYSDSLSCYHTTPFCYKYFKFSGDVAQYELYEYMGYSNTKALINDLISDFKLAINETNKKYAAHLKRLVEQQRANEIKRRQAEIERLEKENDLNSFLKGLI